MNIIKEDKQQSYILVKNEDGTESLKTYDEEYKMWVYLSFSDRASKASEDIMNILSNEYINHLEG